MARPMKRKPQIRWWNMKKQEEKGCIHTSSDEENPSDADNLNWQEINQILVETAKEEFGENIWKRSIHREINVVLARRYSESSGININIQAVPDDQS